MKRDGSRVLRGSQPIPASSAGNGNSPFRLAVLSDLHVFDRAEPGSAPSFIEANRHSLNPLEDPVGSLQLLIKEHKLNANVLLCAGDICDRACPKGLSDGWSKIKELGDALEASMTVATPGNHDVDSRHIRDTDSFRMLRDISDFPITDRAARGQFWSEHYAIVTPKSTDSVRVVILNSSAHHGGLDIEKNHGRIDDSTLRRLANDLCLRGRVPANILLCHHHPHDHSELGLGESDLMVQGGLLLRCLTDSQSGNWIVVHGHKHHPRITYASGGAITPVVFAAASFSAHLPAPLYSRASNQFHVINIDLARSARDGVAGWVQSWSFCYGLGWVMPPTSATSGLPHRAGFGYRGSITELAERVDNVAKTRFTPWVKLIEAIPDLVYVTPQDFGYLRVKLQDRRIKLLEADGEIEMVGRV